MDLGSHRVVSPRDRTTGTERSLRGTIVAGTHFALIDRYSGLIACVGEASPRLRALLGTPKRIPVMFRRVMSACNRPAWTPAMMSIRCRRGFSMRGGTDRK